MSVVLCLVALVVGCPQVGLPHACPESGVQRPLSLPVAQGPMSDVRDTGRTTPLADLLEEAARENPSIQAALNDWHAATEVVPQVSALPDPHVSLQHMAVGAPLPFSNFTTNNFAYLGVGVSQELPYPGTLALRGRAASRAGDVAQAQLDVVRRRVRAEMTTAYARLGAIQATLTILDRDAAVLAQVSRIAEARYRAGEGSQQELLRAQLEQTKLQRELARHQQHHALLEAEIKQLVGRAQTSPDIVADAPSRTPLPTDLPRLLEEAAAENPTARGAQRTIEEQQARVALARNGFKPDFTAQFMWQHTADRFPDYYMFSFDVRVPLYWRHRQAPALAEATDRLSSARAAYQATIQSDQQDVRDAFARAQTADRLLTIDQQGLLPQARAAFQAGLAAYQSGGLDFESLLGSFRDVLSLETEYWQTLADREAALAELDALTGSHR